MFFYRFIVIYKKEESLLIIAMTLQEKILIESDSIKNSLIVFADLRTLKKTFGPTFCVSIVSASEIVIFKPHKTREKRKCRSLNKFSFSLITSYKQQF